MARRHCRLCEAPVWWHRGPDQEWVLFGRHDRPHELECPGRRPKPQAVKLRAWQPPDRPERVELSRPLLGPPEPDPK